MMTTTALKPQNAAEEIRKAVFELKAEFQRQREISRERLHQAIIIALHTNCLWKRAKWT